MRILYLTHRESDYGASFLYHGLKNLLGDTVTEFPWKLSYHNKVDKYKHPDGKPGVTGPPAWMKKDYGGTKIDKINDLAKMVDKKEFDVIVLSALRKTQIKTLKNLTKKLDKIDIPIIVCDGEDSERLLCGYAKDVGARAMFKREFLKSANIKFPVFPLPFSAPYDMFPKLPTEKTVDVLFSMGNTHQKRQETFNSLIPLKDEFNIHCALSPDHSRNKYSDKLLPWPGYIQKIASAKIAVSVRGFGWDTCRYWEIPPTGTMMLCDKVGIHIPNPFKDGVHISCFNSKGDFKNKVKHFLQNDDKRESIAAAGKEHALKYHTCKARATYFIDKVRSLI